MVSILSDEEVERAIIAAFNEGDIAAAERVIHEVEEPLFAFTLGYDALDRIFASAPEGVAQKSELFLAAICLNLTKHGRARRAHALLLDSNIEFKKTYLFDLTEIMVHIHLGENISEDRLKEWQRLEGRLPIDRPLYSGLYYNCMLSFYVRLNMLAQAKMIGAQALESYERAKQPYLQYFIHLHLADIAIVEGNIRQARQHIYSAERFFSIANVCISSERELTELLWLLIDFETGKFEHIPERAAIIRQALVDGDSWSEIFVEVCRIGALSIYFLQGRKLASAFLRDCQVDYHRRHGTFSKALDAVQAHVELIDGLRDSAQAFLADYQKRPMYSSIGVAISEIIRLKVKPEIVGEDYVVDENNTRSSIVAELAKASLAQSENERARTRMHVENAMRIAVGENLTSVFLEFRDVVSKTSAQLATGKFAHGHRRLAHFAKRVHQLVRTSYVLPKEYENLKVTTQQMRVLNAMQGGNSNKKIAVNLGLTEATVKYHLSNLFKLFDVSSRGELIEKIERISLSDKSHTF